MIIIKKNRETLKLWILKQVSYVAYHVTKNLVRLNIVFLSQYLPMNKVIQLYLKDLEYYVTSTKYSNEPMLGKKQFSFNFIKKGDWDKNVKRILPYYYYQTSKYATSFRSTCQIFKNGVPYWHTDEYKMRLYGKGNYIKFDIRDIDEKFKELEKLYLSIKNEGYKNQRELEADKYQDCNETLKDEVTVAIGRDGNILKLAERGNHRLAIAQILGVEKIPVYVQGVHSKWALDCCKKHKTHLLEAINAELAAMNIEKIN